MKETGLQNLHRTRDLKAQKYCYQATEPAADVLHGELLTGRMLKEKEIAGYSNYEVLWRFTDSYSTSKNMVKTVCIRRPLQILLEFARTEFATNSLTVSQK